MRSSENMPNLNAYYEPNSFSGPVENRQYTEPDLSIEGAAGRYDHREGNDDFIQPRALYNLFNQDQKNRLFSNLAEAMLGVNVEIIERQCQLFDKIDKTYAESR